MEPDSDELPLPELFARAVDLDDGGRRTLLADVAARDRALGEELERLLHEAAKSVSPLDRSPWIAQAGDDADPPPPPVPERIGAYRIVSELGRGGMGVVYHAHDPRLGRDVALKVLTARLADDPRHASRFEREARTLAALDHPNIVTIHSVEEADGLRFLTMELVRGGTLADSRPAEGWSAARVLEISLALADALAAAHERGVTHRDLKPGNIMVTATGRLKILDFGLAKQLGGDAERSAVERPLTEVGAVLGTLPYMSPEQVQGMPADARSDVFSLGCLLYETATGRRPFPGRNAAALTVEILRDAPPPLEATRGDLPAEFEAIVRRCLEKEPNRRFPSAVELRRALGELSGGSVDPAPPAASADRPRSRESRESTGGAIRTIAVLPLENLSGLAAEDYFADGMTEALITDLAKSGRVRVIARTSSMPYKGTSKPVDTIARELTADAVVVGSVLRSGERVRITAQLVRAGTGEHLWAERYERLLEDVLSLQDEVTRAIVREIDATLRWASSGEPPPARRVDPEAYLLELRGRQLWNRRTVADFRSAHVLFQQAVDRDPTYAPAWIGVAESLAMLGSYGILPSGEILPRASAAARRALALDPSSAEAHRVLAFLAWQFEFAWSDAIREYEQALRLDPNSALATYWYGLFRAVIGDFGRADDLLARAAALDPLSPLVPAVQGWTRFFARRYDEAIPRYRRVLEIDPHHHVTLWFLGEALVETGEYSAGIAALEESVELSGRIPRQLGYLGYAYGRGGREERARGILAELEQISREHHVPPYFRALVHAGLGEHEAALDQLERGLRERDSMLRDLKADPHWDRMRDLPRFRALALTMAFPESPWTAAP